MNDSIRTLNLLEDRFNQVIAHRYHETTELDIAVRSALIEIVAAVGQVRNLLVREEAAALERVLTEAAPAGATPQVHISNPAEHPSTQPPPASHLHVVKGLPDDS